MTTQRTHSDGEHPDASPSEGRVIARITIGNETYEAVCTSKDEARAWIREQAMKQGRYQGKAAITAASPRPRPVVLPAPEDDAAPGPAPAGGGVAGRKEHGLPGDRLLRVDEVAAFLRMSRTTVYRMAAEGTLPSVRLGFSRRFSAAAIEAWLAERRGEMVDVAGD